MKKITMINIGKRIEKITKKKMVLINIGCGPIGHDDWINLDYGILAFFT